MSQFIYISKFPASPEATKRQQMHFEADINFAYSEEYSFIKSSDNMTFQIVSPTELVEVDVTEEQLQAAADNMQSLTEEPSIFEEEDYCITCHNIMLIDQIINNTLLQEGQLSTYSCDNMLKLAHLKQMLGDC
jgi:hypothetical protein